MRNARHQLHLQRRPNFFPPTPPPSPYSFFSTLSQTLYRVQHSQVVRPSLIPSSSTSPAPRYYFSKMAEATPYTVHITPENVGLWKAKQTDGVAKKASELLQEDLEVRSFHILSLPI